MIDEEIIVNDFISLRKEALKEPVEGITFSFAPVSRDYPLTFWVLFRALNEGRKIFPLRGKSKNCEPLGRGFKLALKRGICVNEDWNYVGTWNL